MPRLIDARVRLCCLSLIGLVLLASGNRSTASELRRTAFVDAIERAKPAVVNIHGNKTVPASDENGKQKGDGESQRVNGMGTGVVIDPRGYIVTNFHVVDGVQQIRVNLHNGRSTIATVVAHDAPTDLALIKIPVTEPMSTIKLGNSSDLMLCEDVVAIGNAFGYEHTVTRGIISALHRSVQVSDAQYYHDLIQTDASINPGNSGGPLINIDGEMVGINAAVRMGAQGIGFAIPVDKVLEVTSRMIQQHAAGGVDHGLVLEAGASAGGAGLRTRKVKPASPAEKAGLKAGDQVLQVEGRPVQHRVDLDLALLERRAGDSVPVVIQRGSETLDVNLVLGRRGAVERNPAEEQAWSLLGLKLEKMDEEDFRNMKTQFTGGLRVTEVRRNGPAWQHNIREGDVLVGLQELETLNLNHISYILNQAQTDRSQPVSFFIVRDGEPYSGKMQITWPTATRTASRPTGRSLD
ncbi:MAG: trypsin-like peptidase domain-containing protein [Pirellulales bacterium]